MKVEEIIGIRGFSLDRVLDSDAEFLRDDQELQLRLDVRGWFPLAFLVSISLFVSWSSCLAYLCLFACFFPPGSSCLAGFFGTPR